MVQGKQKKTMSKSQILNSISQHKPAPADLPEPLKRPGKSEKTLLQAFIEVSRSAGSVVEQLDSLQEVDAWIKRQQTEGKRVLELSDPVKDPDGADLVVIRGQMGVAENGAVWIDEKDMQVRSLPFATAHLVLVLDRSKILPDLHEAYRQVDLQGSGFGVFIAGPSKTADIEQSLVIGAHGPIAHTILLYS
jgi:L-lactate dehydrogenase complex protein LldG